MPRKRPAAAEAAEEQPAQRSRGEALPTEFDVIVSETEAVTVESSGDDPWHVARRGIVVKPYTSWWDPNDKSTDRSGNSCEVVGYVPDFEDYPGGIVDDAYIVANEYGGTTSYYPMRPKQLWTLLAVKDRPAVSDSDAEDLDRDEVDGAGVGGRQRGRRSSGRELAANAPRLGDQYAEEINAIVDGLHGTKEEGEEEVDEETGEVKRSGKSAQRQPSGWADGTHSEKPEYCALPEKLKLKQPIPRKHCPPGKLCTWRLVDSFRLCWPVITMVTEGTNKYYDYQVELNEEGIEGAKKLKLCHSSWPKRELNEETGEMEGGITEAHYEGYLSIIFFMGVVKCADMDWHWRVPKPSSGMPDWHHNFVRRIMGRNDFHLMRRFLHYSDARAKVPRGDWKKAATGKTWVPPPDGYDMIHNFRPVMDECNLAWCKLVVLVTALTYDEQMVKLAMHSSLSRRQPNKPIRDGFQLFALCAASGSWCYCCWIDQGKNDPALYPPYVYGWHAAIILHLITLANVAGTWATIAFDQAFPTPALFLALARLGIYAVGTCQQNRRGFPSLQIAEKHKVRDGGFKAFKVVGQVVNLCHGVEIAGKWVFLFACQWFDKNVVTMLSNKHGDDMKPYMYKAKGELEPLESVQPETREEYNDTNNGVDLVDQQNSATINPHGSRLTIWHRMHDHYANQASQQACTHFRLVIDTHGTREQKREINGWVDAEGKHHGGKRTDDLRWMLMAQLAEGANFGCEGDPRVCNLRRGTPMLLTTTAGVAKKTQRRRPADDDDDDCDGGDDDDAVAEAPPRVERRQGDVHVMAQTAAKGKCAYCKSCDATSGCKACGVRFCGGTRREAPYACMNAHLRGDAVLHPARKKVVWWDPEA